MTVRALFALSALSLALLAASCGGRATETIKIGVLADCEGAYGFAGDPSYAGAELPLISRGARRLGSTPSAGVSEAEIAGKKVQLFLGCGDDTAQETLSEARRLVEDDHVDVLIGPTQIGESFVLRDYARKRPQTTFVDGTAAGQALTLNDPIRNFFRFSTDGAQWVAGLGAYAYNELGWRRAATVAPDEGFMYTQVAGFMAEFCALGGTIVKRFWSPPGDVSGHAARNRIDGYFVGDTANFTTEFNHLRGTLAKRIVGGINLSAPLSPELVKRAAGLVVASPGPPESTRPAWSEYLAGLHKAFPALDPLATSIFAIAYYDAMAAVLKDLEQTHGDLAGGERRFQAALANVRFDSPVGPIRLDPNRQAIAPNFLLQWQRTGNGGITTRTIRAVPNVDQSFGGYFHTNGPLPSRTDPPCKHGNPPPWARSG